MEILVVNGRDIQGARFNGFHLLNSITNPAFNFRMAVWQKNSTDPKVYEMRKSWLRWGNGLASRLSNALSLEGLFTLAGSALPSRPYFKGVDLLHLQLIQSDRYFSPLSLKKISRLVPIVWTLHDLWPMTGMCIYSFECEKWQSGCKGICRHPRGNSPLRFCTPALNWKIKQSVYKQSRLHLVVASKLMQSKVKQSPLLKDFPCELIPFGIDLNVFSPRSKSACRAELGIPENCDVIAFRAREIRKDSFKGVFWIKQALMEYQPQRPTCLLFFDEGKDFGELQRKYILKNLGYIREEIFLSKVLSASDIFLMPSLQESFGVMAIEAMASGTPVIVSEGTSLPEVIHAPSGGLAVPAKNSTALVGAISQLLNNVEMRRQLGFQARRIAEQEYSFDLYASRHLNLYDSVISKNRERDS
jgi:glycosyltransferase involved in cell wall biosynthesis